MEGKEVEEGERNWDRRSLRRKNKDKVRKRAEDEMLEDELKELRVIKGKKEFDENEFEEEYSCEICKKKYKSKGMFGNHLESKDHLKKEIKIAEKNGLLIEKTDEKKVAEKKNSKKSKQKDNLSLILENEKNNESVNEISKESKKVNLDVEKNEKSKTNVTKDATNKKWEEKSVNEIKLIKKDNDNFKKTKENSKSDCEICSKTFENRTKLFQHLHSIHKL